MLVLVFGEREKKRENKKRKEKRERERREKKSREEKRRERREKREREREKEHHYHLFSAAVPKIIAFSFIFTLMHTSRQPTQFPFVDSINHSRCSRLSCCLGLSSNPWFDVKSLTSIWYDGVGLLMPLMTGSGARI